MTPVPQAAMAAARVMAGVARVAVERMALVPAQTVYPPHRLRTVCVVGERSVRGRWSPAGWRGGVR
jgi:hypothetical protein